MKTLVVLFVLVIAAATSACSINRALDEPHKKDYNVLQPGTSRDLVRAELGQPLVSVSHDDCDVFSFQEGSSGWKYMRAVSYGVLDVATLGAAELATNPTEAAVGKDKLRVRACYDARQNVVYSERLEVGKNAKLMTGALSESVNLLCGCKLLRCGPAKDCGKQWPGREKTSHFQFLARRVHLAWSGGLEVPGGTVCLRKAARLLVPRSFGLRAQRHSRAPRDP